MLVRYVIFVAYFTFCVALCGCGHQRIGLIRFLTLRWWKATKPDSCLFSVVSHFSLSVLLWGHFNCVHFTLFVPRVLSLDCFGLIVSTSTSDWLERPINEMIFYVLMETLNPIHSFIGVPCYVLCSFEINKWRNILLF